MRREIERADLFIAILTPESPSPNVLFEIGCAYGLQKQLLIMAPRGVSLPTDIQELQYIRADAQNREALSFALDQALAPKKSSSQRKTSVEKTKPLGKKVRPLLATLHAQPQPREAELLRIGRRRSARRRCTNDCARFPANTLCAWALQFKAG